MSFHAQFKKRSMGAKTKNISSGTDMNGAVSIPTRVEPSNKEPIHATMNFCI
jgi:hypothetical protein